VATHDDAGFGGHEPSEETGNGVAEIHGVLGKGLGAEAASGATE
jgi:hypothetical protein